MTKGLAIAGISLGGVAILLMPVIALLAAIAIPNLLRARISANDALAQSTLRTLSTASETFAVNNDNRYPESIYELTEETPPYITENYCDKTISGYTYSCELGSQEYTFTATPEEMGTTGTRFYSIKTGGVMTP